MKRSHSFMQLCGAIMLLGMLSGLWATPSFAQDAPEEPTVEDATGEAADGDATGEDGEAAAGDEADGEATGEDAVNADTLEEAEEAAEAELADVEVEEADSPWSPGLMTSLTALLIGGFSAVLGIWVDRDKNRPVIFAVVMSILITAAIGVGATQSYLDAVGAIQQKEDLNRMLGMVGEIAASSGDESLAALVKSEGGEEVEMLPQEEVVEEEIVEEEPAEGEPAEDAEGEPTEEAPADEAANQ